MWPRLLPLLALASITGACEPTRAPPPKPALRPIADLGTSFSDSATSAPDTHIGALDAGVPNPAPGGSVTEDELGNLLVKTIVPCRTAANQTPGTSHAVADRDRTAFWDGSAALGGAPASTKNWAGEMSVAVIVWDINACDFESFDIDWSSAGFLVRGATVSGDRLRLARTMTEADINLVDVGWQGTWELDTFGPDDSQLVDAPQLINPVNAAKSLLVSIARR